MDELTMSLSRRSAIHSVVASGVSTVAAARIATAAESPGSVQGGVTIVNVRAFGAIGDGIADDTSAIQDAVDDCFGKADNPNSGPRAHLNKPLYFPQGIYKTTAPIVFTNVRGGHIFGAGRHTTTVKNVAGTSVFRTNGFEFSRIEMIRLSAPGKVADVLDLDWTHTGGTALQSNTFAEMYFDSGAIGVNIGKSDYMGSENLFLNCFFSSCAVAGVKTSNFNALQNTLFGGNIQSCPVGVWVDRGCCSVYSTGFQICKTFDIVVNNSANDTMVVSGVRSESLNFIQLRNGITAQIVGCSHLNSADGIFADIGNSQANIDSCVSLRGIVKGDGMVRTSNSSFGRTDWIDVASIRDGINEVQNCFVGGTRNVSFRTSTLIARKIVTSSGNQWPLNRQLIAIKSGTSKVAMSIAAGARIQKVTLILDAAGTSGTVTVGDSDNPSRYFNVASLTGSSLISSTIEHRYATADILLVQCTNATEVTGFVAVDFVVES
jgi:hypothetical protein